MKRFLNLISVWITNSDIRTTLLLILILLTVPTISFPVLGKEEKGVISMGIVETPPFSDYSILMEMVMLSDFPSRENLTFQRKLFASPEQAFRALLNGEVDFVVTSGLPALREISRGVPIKIFAVVAKRSPYPGIVVPREIQNIDQLINESVGIAEFELVTFRLTWEGIFVPSKLLPFSVANYTELQKSLILGRVKGAFLPYYYTRELLIKQPEEFYILPMVSFSPVFMEYPNTVLVARGRDLETNPLIYARISSVILSFLNAVYQQRDVWVKLASLSKPELNAIILSEIWNYSRAGFATSALISRSSFDAFVSFYSRFLKKEVTFRETFDTTPARVAQIALSVNITLTSSYTLLEALRGVVKDELEDITTGIRDIKEGIRELDEDIEDISKKIEGLKGSVNAYLSIVASAAVAIAGSVVLATLKYLGIWRRNSSKIYHLSR